VFPVSYAVLGITIYITQRMESYSVNDNMIMPAQHNADQASMLQVIVSFALSNPMTVTSDFLIPKSDNGEQGIIM